MSVSDSTKPSRVNLPPTLIALIAVLFGGFVGASGSYISNSVFDKKSSPDVWIPSLVYLLVGGVVGAAFYTVIGFTFKYRFSAKAFVGGLKSLTSTQLRDTVIGGITGGVAQLALIRAYQTADALSITMATSLHIIYIVMLDVFVLKEVKQVRSLAIYLVLTISGSMLFSIRTVTLTWDNLLKDFVVVALLVLVLRNLLFAISRVTDRKVNKVEDGEESKVDSWAYTLIRFYVLAATTVGCALIYCIGENKGTEFFLYLESKADKFLIPILILSFVTFVNNLLLSTVSKKMDAVRLAVIQSLNIIPTAIVIVLLLGHNLVEPGAFGDVATQPAAIPIRILGVVLLIVAVRGVSIIQKQVKKSAEDKNLSQAD